MTGKRRKSGINDSMSNVDISQILAHTNTNININANTNKFSGGIKSQYDAVMETIVQKDEEVKKCKS